MKVVRGVNPDFADFSELDEDALEVVEEFLDGTATLQELISLVGPEAAQEIRDRRERGDEDIDVLFDDPEHY